jgi:ElaB/YqjD/DUF883 family membrane-anchored ribosome-binding protein
MAQTPDAAKDKLVEDFNTVIADTEQLLKSVAATGGEKARDFRATVEQNLKVARERLSDLEELAMERTREAARATDGYVRDNPWRSLGIAATVAAVAGIILGLMLNRR